MELSTTVFWSNLKVGYSEAVGLSKADPEAMNCGIVLSEVAVFPAKDSLDRYGLA